MDNAAENFRFLRFYQKENDKFFENFSVWQVDLDGTKKSLKLNYPEENEPLAGTEEHIVPSPDALPNLSEHDSYFHMATLCPPDGIRVVYSLIFLLKKNAELKMTSKHVTIQKDAIVILVIESKFLHPLHFKAILTQIFNHIRNVDIVNEFNYYIHPTIVHRNFQSEFESLPFDISVTTEIGRFHHFIFSIFQPNQVLNILISLLLGQSIFVTSLDTVKICTGCFALLALLYPIIWPNVFISTLPKNMLETANSPFPFIIGLQFQLFLKEEMQYINPCGVVNLDCGNFISNEGYTIPRPIKVLISKASDLLNAELDICKTSHVFPAYRIQLILWQFVFALLLISTNKANEDLSNPNIIKNLASHLLDLKQKPKKESFLTWIFDSNVLNYFASHVVNNFISYFPEDFMKVVHSKDMKNLISDIGPQKKKKQ